MLIESWLKIKGSIFKAMIDGLGRNFNGLLVLCDRNEQQRSRRDLQT